METKKYLKEKVALLEKENQFLKDKLKDKKTKKLKLKVWKPKTEEDKLLNKYWKKTGGKLIVEVPIGGNHPDLPWGHGSTIRRLDGVIIKQDDLGGYRCSHNRDELSNMFKGKNRKTTGSGLHS